MSKNYEFVQNKNCEYFPCHEGISEDEFNCLFCFCPLYMLGEACGGNYKYTNGVKDCSDCTIPHGKNSYKYIMSKMELVIDRTKKKKDD